MTSAKNPKEKQPGEKPPGKFHYNPGNMAGKEAEACKDKDAPQDSDEERSGSDKQG